MTYENQRYLKKNWIKIPEDLKWQCYFWNINNRLKLITRNSYWWQTLKHLIGLLDEVELERICTEYEVNFTLC